MALWCFGYHRALLFAPKYTLVEIFYTIYIAIQLYMNKIDSHIHEITSCVWAFVDKIADDKINIGLLEAHGVSRVAISAIKTPGYIGINVYRKSIFMHLMSSIGYYDLLSQGPDSVLSLSIADVKQRLYSPESWSNFKREQMKNYPLVAGVKNSIDYINNTLSDNTLCGCIGNIVPSGCNLKSVKPGYEISFCLPYNCSIKENFNQELENENFSIGSNQFIIQPLGCHISKWTRYMTKDDEVSLCLTHFNSYSVSPDKKYYQRYIIEVRDWVPIVRNIGFGLVSLDGIECNGSIINIEGVSYSIYFFKDSSKNYLAIDSNEKVTEQKMRDVAFSISVAIGLLTGDLHLGEYWMIASDDNKNREPKGLFYSSLTPSIHSDYTIFTTNVYSVLVPIAKKLDPKNGERRAISIINSCKLSYALEPISIDVFENLAENFERYESLQRGIYILLTGTRLSLELQAGAFAIALEAICNISKEVIKDSKEEKLSKKAWREIRPLLVKLSNEQLTAGVITGTECKYLEKKINALNNGFNSDKLESLLVYYKYPLTALDSDAIKFRNPLLHGDIKIKKMSGPDFDVLFSISLRLHKLCSCIPLLMAGYSGYIINNCKLYGYESTCKAFIKLESSRVKYTSKIKWYSKIQSKILKTFDLCLNSIGLRRL